MEGQTATAPSGMSPSQRTPPEQEIIARLLMPEARNSGPSAFQARGLRAMLKFRLSRPIHEAMPGPRRDGQLRDPATDAHELTSLLVAEVQDYAILMLDLEGRVATWNAGARRFKGYEAEEIIGRHFSVFYPAQAIADGTPEKLLETARSEGRVEQEGWRVRKDGSLFWASVVITAIRDERGELRGYGKVTRDLTERHAVEMARRAAEERFRAAFTHAPVGIAITGLEGAAYGRLVEANPALTRMLGYGPDELSGRTLTSITFAEDRDATVRALQELSVGSAISVELRLAHCDGREAWVLLSSTPLPDPAHTSLRCAITQILDISERKRFESHLRHLADHDALTGLLNRHRFESELARVTAEVRRYRRRASLLEPLRAPRGRRSDQPRRCPAARHRAHDGHRRSPGRRRVHRHPARGRPRGRQAPGHPHPGLGARLQPDQRGRPARAGHRLDRPHQLRR
jgi:PAS domain S-box-containing protein